MPDEPTKPRAYLSGDVQMSAMGPDLLAAAEVEGYEVVLAGGIPASVADFAKRGFRIDASNVVVASIEHEPSPSVMWDLGYAFGKHKLVVIFLGESVYLPYLAYHSAISVVRSVDAAQRALGEMKVIVQVAAVTPDVIRTLARVQAQYKIPMP